MRHLLLLVALVGCGREAPPAPKVEAAAAPPAAVAVEADAATAGPPEQAAPALPAELQSQLALLMPDTLLAERVDLDPLVVAIKAIEAEIAGLYARGDLAVTPIAVYIAAKPGTPGLRAWAVGLDGPLAAKDAALIEKKAGAVGFPPVRGAIALSLQYPRKGSPQGGPAGSMPQPWIDASEQAGRPLSIPDELLAKVWPD